MSDRVPATTIGELDIHLSNMQSRLVEMAGSMATKEDFTRLNNRMNEFAAERAHFATKAELVDLRRDVEELRPSNLFMGVAKVSAGLAAIAAAVMLTVKFAQWIGAIP